MLGVLAMGFFIGMTHAMPPGPVTFEVLKRGVSDGLTSALKVDVGSVMADAVFFALIVAGLSQVMSYPAGKVAMWLARCLLLAFLGLRGVYGSLRGKLLAPAGKKNDTPPLLSGFLICITGWRSPASYSLEGIRHYYNNMRSGF